MENGKTERIEKAEFLSGGPVYGLFAIVGPVFFLGTAVFLIAAVVPIPLPLFRVMATGFVTTLGAAVYYDVLRDRLVNHAAAHIRGGVAVTALAYAVVSLCGGLHPAGDGFIPGIANIGAALASLYMWSMTLIFKQVFRGQRQFEKFAESLSGEALRSAIIENPELISTERIDKMKKMILVHFSVIGALAFAAFFSKTSVVLPLIIFLLFITAVSVCMLGFFALMKQEYAFAGEGLSISKVFRLRQILGIFLFAGAGVVFAFLLSSNRSLLPLSLIVRFFAWLASLFYKPIPLEVEPILYPEAPPTMPIGQQLAETFGVTQPWAGWKYVRRGFIALAVLAFLFFMLKPLFAGNFFHSLAKGRANFKRIWKEFLEWLTSLKNWRGILMSIVSFFKERETRRLIRRKNAGDISRVSGAVLAAYTPAKKKKIQQSVNLFAQLIIWGDETLGVVWKPSLAPGEFCALLSSAVPERERGDAVIRCGDLFEQSLYSQNELMPIENNEFSMLVEKIVNSEDAPDASQD
ncbi:MAG: hypothetical protein LBG05_07200 [Treponema sp.]|jgi:hypothetical protein|nr:hypothetical protein [Treponema sp.]